MLIAGRRSKAFSQRVVDVLPTALVLIVAAVTVPFALWAKAKTEGGWHWRWGSD